MGENIGEMTFSEKLDTILIPAMERMFDKEISHLRWLKKQKQTDIVKGFIYESMRLIGHIRERIVDYKEYSRMLSKEQNPEECDATEAK